MSESESLKSPIARLIADAPDEPDRDAPCAICSKPTPIPGFVMAIVKTWNNRAASPSDFIRMSDIGNACPGACTAELHKRKHDEYQAENETTIAYLAMLHVGKFNPESLAWLRKHGCGRYVERLLAREGTAKAHP